MNERVFLFPIAILAALTAMFLAIERVAAWEDALPTKPLRIVAFNR